MRLAVLLLVLAAAVLGEGNVKKVGSVCYSYSYSLKEANIICKPGTENWEKVEGSSTDLTNSADKCFEQIVAQCDNLEWFQWRASNNQCACVMATTCPTRPNNGLNTYDLTATEVLCPEEGGAAGEAGGGVQNEGEDCWKECNKTQGPCAFCGAGGLCCRHGWHVHEGGCDGFLGIEGRNHVCVAEPVAP